MCHVDYAALVCARLNIGTSTGAYRAEFGSILDNFGFSLGHVGPFFAQDVTCFARDKTSTVFRRSFDGYHDYRGSNFQLLLLQEFV